jgi:hypothetical protein
VQLTNVDQHTLRGITASPAQQFEDLKINRRNHVIEESHKKLLTNTLFLLYNGYDFFHTSLKEGAFSEFIGLNLGAKIVTREINVVHKTKITKGARKTQGKKIKKSVGASKTFKKVMRTSLSKKFKK